MDGYHHCTKCGLKYRINDVQDGVEYTYTCANCGQIETFHMSGKHSTIDCPICSQTVGANYKAIRSLKFNERYNSMYGGL
jgi:DNA-directed RNA polymerase subunit RPC12/RpoP